jgi:hypothetical protein
MTKLVISIMLCACPLLFSTSATSQRIEPNQKSTLPDAPAAQIPPSQNSNQQSVQFVIYVTRRSYWFPDLATHPAPVPAKGKFELFLNESISGHAIAGSAASAGLDQAFNWYAGYGQGAAGYGKRFGAQMARNSSNNLFGTFVFATMLRRDPRFFVRNIPSFWGAVKYSLDRIVMTRDDSGAEVVNSSGLLGPLAGEALANTYLPPESRTVESTFARYASDIGWRAAGNRCVNIGQRLADAYFLRSERCRSYRQTGHSVCRAAPHFNELIVNQTAGHQASEVVSSRPATSAARIRRSKRHSQLPKSDGSR